MTILERLTIMFTAWAVFWVLANPWLEGPRRRCAAIACGIAASVCFVLQGMTP